jgi:hypothetical protein
MQKEIESGSQSDSSARKTRSITFRLDSNVIDELQTEADNNETSLNVLVNQILRRYEQWDRYESKIGMMPVPKVMLSALIEKAVEAGKKAGIKNIEQYKEDIIKHAAQIAFGLMKDSVLYMKRQYNLWVLLSVLQEYMKVSGINSDHQIEGRKHVFVIQHDLGENWSLFVKEVLRIIFEDLAKVKAEIRITPNTTVAEVVI